MKKASSDAIGFASRRLALRDRIVWQAQASSASKEKEREREERVFDLASREFSTSENLLHRERR